MVVSIVEHATGTVSSTSTPTATLTTTPAAGDVIVAVLVGGQNASTYVSASGCGATWANLYAPTGTTAGQRMFVAGTGATSAGTVTVTVSAVRACFLHLYLVRGLTSTAVVGVNSATSVNAATFQGTSQTAGPGQIVIGAARANVTSGGMTIPSSGALPSSAAWTGRTALASAFLGTGSTATAIPSSSDTFALEVGVPSGTASFNMSQIVLGTEAVSGDRTGTVAASLPKLSAAAAGTVLPPPRTSVVSASLPKLGASATGSFTPPPRTGTVAASLPALSAFVDGAVVAPGAFAGSVDATLPKLGASVAGDVSAPAGVSGAVNAPLPKFGAKVEVDSGSAVVMVERRERSYGDLGTSSSVTFTTTPQPGDHVFIVAQTNGTNVTFGASGMGASFEVEHSSWLGGQDVVLIGSNPTSAGTVTVTLSSARDGHYVAYLVRGMPAGVQADVIHHFENDAVNQVGLDDYHDPQRGQFVAAAVVAYQVGADGTVQWPYQDGSPPLKWVYSDWSASDFGYSGSAYYVADPNGAGTYVTRVASAMPDNDTADIRLTQVLFIPPTAGTVTATLPAAFGATVAGTYTQPPLLGTVHATLPSFTTDIEGAFTPPVIAEAWTLDDSQIDLALVHDDDPVLAIVEAPPAAIPAALTPRLITRQSHQLDPADLEADPTTGQRRAPGTHAVVTEDVGYPHIWVDGQDVTYFGGARTRIGTITSSTPGGDGTTSLTFPTLTSLDQAGTGEWAWLRPGALVDIALVSPAGVRLTPHIFNGSLVSDEPRLDTRTDAQTWAVVGTFAGADVQQRHRAPIVMNRADLGLIIPRVLNKVVGRSYGPFAAVRTDIRSNSRGTYAQSVWQYVSDLLARAWTTNGRQWTIRRTTTPRQYELALRDTTTAHWTVTAGAYGVEVDLDSDYSETYNVVYGHGIAKDGYYWGNWKHPALSLVAPPAYPFNDPSTDIDVGTTDDDTDTGDGVTTWQRRMKALGYAVTVDGVYSAADETQARKIQKDRGLKVGGGVGPQTWVATFDEGTTGADLSKSYRAPLAWLPEVEPYLYSANGAVIATNPAYNPAIERRESEDIDFGTGRSKAEGVAEAEAMLARNSDPGWVGTITLRTDPWEGSRWFMFEDQNVMLLGHRGENRLLHIVARSLDPESGQVTLTVDSKFRDALTVSQIRDRNKESRLDPARRPGNANRRSRLDQDILVPFDGESGAGHFYKRPVNGDAGLWSVVPVFISEAGQLVRVSMRSTGPASKFWVALFGSEKTANWMAANVGDPGAAGAWDDVIENGDNNGLIEQWGNDSQACGETPGGSVNGRFEDTGGVSYYSTHGGWVWVAVYADQSCFLEGRFYPAPIQ